MLFSQANLRRLAASCVFLCSASAQAFFDKEASNAAGETKYTASRVLACHLIKTSYKGDNEGFFSSADKSVEAACQDRDGALMEFSATMQQWEKLRNYAGRSVLVYLSKRKLESAKTDWTLIDLDATQEKNFVPEKLCGPEEGKTLLQDQKVWSRGFRIAWIYDAERVAKSETWNLQSYVGFTGGSKWVDKGSVQFGEFCRASIHKIMESNAALIFTYVQKDEKPDYLIESVYRMQWK